MKDKEIRILLIIVVIFSMASCILTAFIFLSHKQTGMEIETINKRLGEVEEKYQSIEQYSETLYQIQENLKLLQNEVEALKVTPTNMSVDANTDLSVNTTMTAMDMNRIIDYWCDTYSGESPFKGKGYTFIKAAQETGLDPVYILAHAIVESANGTSRIARDKNNYFGIAAFDATPYSSAYSMGDSVDEGIINGAKWIRTNFYDKGCNSLYLMIYGPKGCYASARDSWINNITGVMNTSYSVLT